MSVVGVAILAALTSASHCSLPPEFIAVAVVGGVVVAAVAMLAIAACEFFAANVGISLRDFVGCSSLLFSCWRYFSCLLLLLFCNYCIILCFNEISF